MAASGLGRPAAPPTGGRTALARVAAAGWSARPRVPRYRLIKATIAGLIGKHRRSGVMCGISSAAAHLPCADGWQIFEPPQPVNVLPLYLPRVKFIDQA